jgi:hypothetical protein
MAQIIIPSENILMAISCKIIPLGIKLQRFCEELKLSRAVRSSDLTHLSLLTEPQKNSR